MPRKKQDEGGKPTTVNLYTTHRNKLAAITQKTKKNNSDLFREWIDEKYRLMFKDTTEELQMNKKQLEQVIAALEELQKKEGKDRKIWVMKYTERKRTMDVPQLLKYEESSKIWIKVHMKDLSEFYPGLSIDELYTVLEKEMNAKLAESKVVQ